MQNKHYIHSLWLGIRRNWKKILTWFIPSYLMMCGIFQQLAYFLPIAKSYIEPYKPYIFVLLGLIAIAYTVWNLYEPLSIRIKITSNGTYLNITFGDIFSEHERSHIAIPVNEFFDTQIGCGSGQIGDIVAENSLHGQFIRKKYNSDTNKLNREIDTALKEVNAKKIRRSIGKNKKYPIGTTAVLGKGPNKSFLFALSHTNVNTNKANADIPTMWLAFEGLWSTIRNHSNGLPVAIPLVGSGQSNLGVDKKSLLQLIILSVKKASEPSKITNEITLILHNSMMDEIALRNINQEFI